MANELRADAMLVFTLRGNMPRYAGWMRPRYSPIYAICESDRLANHLALSWGVTPCIVAFDRDMRENTIKHAIATLTKQGKLKPGNTVVIVSSIPAGDSTVDAVQMRTV
jgi:pyruvate kinase